MGSSPEYPPASKEFLFPYASVIEYLRPDMLKRLDYTLAATALTDIAECSAPLPTNRLTWDQPHEGNLFTHLYKQRALQHAGRTAAAV